MRPRNIAESFLDAIEANDFTKAESYLAKDFKVTGIAPDPLGAKEFLTVHKALGRGLPDFKFNYRIEKEHGDVVDLKVKLTGTHTKEMPAPIPGVKKIPATKKAIQMPEEPVQITVRDNKIEKLQLTQVPNGGLPSLLKQLGAELPQEVHHTH